MRASRLHPGWWAALAHRLSGVALVIFLPLHFLMLGLALEGEAALDAALSWTEQPLVKAGEWGLVTLLTLHLTLGLRVMALELLPWRDTLKTTIATGVGVSLLTGLVFLLNLA